MSRRLDIGLMPNRYHNSSLMGKVTVSRLGLSEENLLVFHT